MKKNALPAAAYLTAVNIYQSFGRLPVPGRVAALGMAIALMVSGPANAVASELRLFSAGSLRAAMTELIDQFGRKTSVHIAPTYGASGMLRQKMAAGDVPDIFASANMEHPLALQADNIVKDTAVFAENRLCVLGAPGFVLQPQRLLEQMRDPRVQLATGSPIVDPAGDYTWAMFRKADAIAPGSFAELEKKALQIMGQPGADGKPMGVLDVLAQKRADMVVAYCSYGRLAREKVDGASWSRLPASLDVASQYGIAVSRSSGAEAAEFVQFVRSPAGQTILRDYGFGQ